MATSHFLERVREDLLREISWVITNKVRDPRVPSVVTVSDVELAADTRNATVYVGVYGDEQTKKGALIALNRAAPFIQKMVGERVSLRNFPKFYFKLDTSLERGMRINELLREVQDDLDRPALDTEQ
jgi:ribosome-binding factor A